MRFIVTGGGTGGHVYPALAIARGLEKRYVHAEILYVGSARGLEAELVPKEGFAFKAIQVAGLKRRLSLDNMQVFWQALLGLREARQVMYAFRPAAVIGTGGYVCGPVVLAAVLTRVPSVIHEQNVMPGITNRLLSRFVRRVTVTFADSIKHLPCKEKVKLTGLPVRPELFLYERKDSRLRLGLPEKGLVVLSFGGSQGARTINNAMIGVLQRFRGNPNVHFLHVTGPHQYDDFMATLKKKEIFQPENGNTTIVPYLHEMPRALAAADLVVCRAGASTLAELTVMGLPAILVPYPFATGNHQEYNARSLERHGAAVVIKDAQLNARILAEQIEELFADPARLQKMAAASRQLGRPRALDDILDCVQELIQ